MRIDDAEMTPELRDKAKRVLATMCSIDGTSFACLRDELDWTDKDVQECLASLNAHGYVVGRVLPSLEMRYCVTELGWSVCELLAQMDHGDSKP